MADKLANLKDLTAIQIQEYNNVIQGSQDTFIYVDNKTGKVVSAAQVNSVPISLGSANINKKVLTKEEAVNFINSNLTEINKQANIILKGKKFTSGSEAVANDVLFDKESNRIGKYLDNTDAASFNFRVTNEALVQKLTELKPPRTSKVIVFPSDLLVQSNNGGIEYSQDTIRIKALAYVPPQKDLLKGQRNERIYSTGTVSTNQFFNGYEAKDYDGCFK